MQERDELSNHSSTQNAADETHLHVTQILPHYDQFLIVYSRDLCVGFPFDSLQVDLVLFHLPQTTRKQLTSVQDKLRG